MLPDAGASGCAAPGAHGAVDWARPRAAVGRALSARQGPWAETGPLIRPPVGVSRYPLVPVSRSEAELAVPPGLAPDVAPATGAPLSLPAVAEERAKLGQPVSKSEPVPVHCAHTANARSPRASSAVTRIPPVLTCVQVWPPSWVDRKSVV